MTDDALRHLQWTLAYPWSTHDGPHRPSTGALTWRGADLSRARRTMSGDPWTALERARHALGLQNRGRQGPAGCRGRRYAYRDGLFERIQRKIGRDTVSGSPRTHAIRAYLDVIHTHPFDDGNARSAVLLADYLLFGEARTVSERWAAILRLPKPPGHDAVPRWMETLL